MEIRQGVNSIHKDIKFTIELENNNKLPYLDTLITRNNKIIKIDWYQKPMASGRLINYYSKHPTNIIRNTANNFIRRIYNISDSIFHTENKKKIKIILKKNNFPTKVINNLINQYFKCNNKERTVEAKIYKSMPYIPNLSERLKKSGIIDNNKYVMTFKANNNMRKIYTNMKTKLDKNETQNVIYRIKCKGNEEEPCNKLYVGTTKSKLKTRISAHKSDIKLLDSTATQHKTALAAHCAKSHHTPDFGKVEILDKENNYNKRLTLEMLHILNTPTNLRLNYKTDTANIAHSYRQLIMKKRNQSSRNMQTDDIEHN